MAVGTIRPIALSHLSQECLSLVLSRRCHSALSWRSKRNFLPEVSHGLARSRASPVAAPLIRGQRRLQVAHRGGAGPPQHIPLAPLAQLPAKPRVAAQRIVTRHPAVRNVLTPLVKPLQALLVSRVIPHLLWHRARLASWRVSCPLLREGQEEVEHGM